MNHDAASSIGLKQTGMLTLVLSALFISSPRVLDWNTQGWEYWSNGFRESFMCLVLWLLLGTAALTPLAKPFVD